jgi:hypothetical protein
MERGNGSAWPLSSSSSSSSSSCLDDGDDDPWNRDEPFSCPLLPPLLKAGMLELRPIPSPHGHVHVKLKWLELDGDFLGKLRNSVRGRLAGKKVAPKWAGATEGLQVIMVKVTDD